MGDDESAPRPTRIQRVRCLSCSVRYVKPVGGGTVSANPGCPACGYVGWVLETSPVKRTASHLRFAADRLQRRTG
jgi:hypothetical protein